MKNRIKVFRAMHDLTQEALARDLAGSHGTLVSVSTRYSRTMNHPDGNR